MKRKGPLSTVTDKHNCMCINENKTGSLEQVKKMQNSTDQPMKILRDCSNYSNSGFSQQNNMYYSGIHTLKNSNEKYTHIKIYDMQNKPNVIGKTLREKKAKAVDEDRLKFEKKSNSKYTRINQCIKTHYKQANIVTKYCPGDVSVPEELLISQSNKTIGTKESNHHFSDFDNANDSSIVHSDRALELCVTCRENELHRQTVVTQSNWEGGSVKVKQTDAFGIQEDSTSVGESAGKSEHRNGNECLHLVHVVCNGYSNDKWNVYSNNKHKIESQTLVGRRSDVYDQRPYKGSGSHENNTREVEENKYIFPNVGHYSGKNIDDKYLGRYVKVSDVYSLCGERYLNRARQANGRDYLPNNTEQCDICTRGSRDNETKYVPASRIGTTDQKNKNKENEFRQGVSSCSHVCGSAVKEKRTSPSVTVEDEKKDVFIPPICNISGQENLEILIRKSENEYQNKSFSSIVNEIASFWDCNKNRDTINVTDKNVIDPRSVSQEDSYLNVSNDNLIRTGHLRRHNVTKHQEDKLVVAQTTATGGESVREVYEIENGVDISNVTRNYREKHAMDANAIAKRQDETSKEHKICKTSQSQVQAQRPIKVRQSACMHVIHESKTELTSKIADTAHVAKNISREGQRNTSNTIGRNNVKTSDNNPKIKETGDFSLTRSKINWKHLTERSRNANICPQKRQCTKTTIQEKSKLAHTKDGCMLQQITDHNAVNNNVLESSNLARANTLYDERATESNINIQQFHNDKSFVDAECDIAYQYAESDTSVIIPPSCLNNHYGIPSIISPGELHKSGTAQKNVSAVDFARSQAVNATVDKSAICIVSNNSSASDVTETAGLREMIDSNILTDVNQNVNYSPNWFRPNSLDSNARENLEHMEVSIKTYEENFPFISSSTDDQSLNNQSLVCSVGRVTERPDNCQSSSSAFMAKGETAEKVILDAEGNYLPESVSLAFNEPIQTLAQERETRGIIHENEIVLERQNLSRDQKQERGGTTVELTSVAGTHSSNVHRRKHGLETKQRTECKTAVTKNERKVSVTNTLGSTKYGFSKETERKTHNRAQGVSNSEQFVTKANSATIRQKWTNLAAKTKLNQLKKNERDSDGKEKAKFKGIVNVVSNNAGAPETKAQKNWQSLADRNRKGLLQKVARNDSPQNESVRQRANNDAHTTSGNLTSKLTNICNLDSTNSKKLSGRLTEKIKESGEYSLKNVCTNVHSNNTVLLNAEKQFGKNVKALNSKEGSKVELCSNTVKQKWKYLASRATKYNPEKCMFSSVDTRCKNMQQQQIQDNSDSVSVDIKNNNMRRFEDSNSRSNASLNLKSNANSDKASRSTTLPSSDCHISTDNENNKTSRTYKCEDVDISNKTSEYAGRKNLNDVIVSTESRRRKKSSLPLPTFRTGNHSPSCSIRSSPVILDSSHYLSASPSPGIKANTLCHHEVFTKSRIPRISSPKSPRTTLGERGSPYLSKSFSESQEHISKRPPTTAVSKQSVLWTRAVDDIKKNAMDNLNVKFHSNATGDMPSTQGRAKIVTPVFRRHRAIQQEKSKVSTNAQGTDNIARFRTGQMLKVKNNNPKDMASSMNSKYPVGIRGTSPGVNDTKLQNTSLNSSSSDKKSQNSYLKTDKMRVPHIRVSHSSPDSKDSRRPVNAGQNIAQTRKSLHVPNKPTISSSAKCQSGIIKSRSPSPLTNRSISPNRMGASAKRTTKKVTSDKIPKMSPKLSSKNVDKTVDSESNFTLEDLIIIAQKIPPRYPDKAKNKVSFKQAAKRIIQQNRKCFTTKVAADDAKYQSNAEQFEILNRSFLELLSEEKSRDQNADSSHNEHNVAVENEDEDEETGAQLTGKHDSDVVTLIQDEATKCSVECEFESFISEHEDSLYEKLQADSTMLVNSFNACLATEVMDCQQAECTKKQQVNCQIAKDCGMKSENKCTEDSYQHNIAHPSESDTTKSNVFVDYEDVPRRHDDNACDASEENIVLDGQTFINLDENSDDSGDSIQMCLKHGNSKQPVSDIIYFFANEGHVERPDTDRARSFSVSPPVQYMTRYQNIYDKESTKHILVCAAAGDTDLIKPSESGSEGNLYTGNSLHVAGINEEDAADFLASSSEELVGNGSLIVESKGGSTDKHFDVKSEELDSVSESHVHPHEQNSADRTTLYSTHTDKKREHSISKCTEEKQNMESEVECGGVCDAKSDNADSSKPPTAVSNKTVLRRNSILERYEQNILLSQKKTDEKINKDRGYIGFSAATKRFTTKKTVTDTTCSSTGNGGAGPGSARVILRKNSFSMDFTEKASEHITELETEVPSPRAKSELVIMDSDKPTNVTRTSAGAISDKHSSECKESHSAKLVNLNSKCMEFEICIKGDKKSVPSKKQINPGKIVRVPETPQKNSGRINTAETDQPDVDTVITHSTESANDVDLSHITPEYVASSVDRPINLENTLETHEQHVIEDRGLSISVDIQLCDGTENNVCIDICKDALPATVCEQETIDTSRVENQPNVTSDATVCHAPFRLSDQNPHVSYLSTIMNTKAKPTDFENASNFYSGNTKSEMDTNSSLLVANKKNQATVIPNICDTKTEMSRDTICKVQKKTLTRGLKRFTAAVNLVQKSIAEEKAKEEQQMGKKPSFKYGKVSEICKLLMEKAKQSKKSNELQEAAGAQSPAPKRKMNWLREGKSWIRVPVGQTDGDSSVNKRNVNTAKTFWQRASAVLKTDKSQDAESKNEIRSAVLENKFMTQREIKTPTDLKLLSLKLQPDVQADKKSCGKISEQSEKASGSQTAETPTNEQEKERNIYKTPRGKEIAGTTGKRRDDETLVFQAQEIDSRQYFTDVIRAEENESRKTTTKSGINYQKDKISRDENMQARNDNIHGVVFEITQFHMEHTDFNTAEDEKTDDELAENRTDVRILDPIIINSNIYVNSMCESERQDRSNVALMKMNSVDPEQVSNSSIESRQLHNYEKQVNVLDQTEFDDKQQSSSNGMLLIIADDKKEMGPVNNQNVSVVHEKMSGFTNDEKTVQQNNIQIGSVELEVIKEIDGTPSFVALCEDSEQNYTHIFQTLDVQEQFPTSKMEIQHRHCDSANLFGVECEILDGRLINSNDNILCGSIETHFLIGEKTKSIKEELEMVARIEDQSFELTRDSTVLCAETEVKKTDDIYGDTDVQLYEHVSKVDGDISLCSNEILEETTKLSSVVIQPDIAVTSDISAYNMVPMLGEPSIIISGVPHNNELSIKQFSTTQDPQKHINHKQKEAELSNVNTKIDEGDFLSVTDYHFSDRMAYVGEPRKSKSRPISRYDIMDLFEPDFISDGSHKLRSKSEERVPPETDIQLVPIILKSVRLELCEDNKDSTGTVDTNQYSTDNGSISWLNQEINSLQVLGKVSIRDGEISCDLYGREGDKTEIEAYQDKIIDYASEAKQDRESEVDMEFIGTLHEVEFMSESGHNIVSPPTEQATVVVVKDSNQSNNTRIHINDQIATTLPENVSNFPLFEDVDQICIVVDSTEFSRSEESNEDNFTLKRISVKQPLDVTTSVHLIGTQIDTHSTSLVERYIPYQADPCHTNNIMFLGIESYDQNFLPELTDILVTLPEGVQYVKYCEQLKSDEESYSVAVETTQYMSSTRVTQSLLHDIYGIREYDPAKRYKNPIKLHEIKCTEAESTINTGYVCSAPFQNSYPVEDPNLTACLDGEFCISKEHVLTGRSEFINKKLQIIPTIVINTTDTKKPYACTDVKADFTFDDDIEEENETDVKLSEQTFLSPIRLKAVKIKEEVFPKEETADDIKPVSGHTEGLFGLGFTSSESTLAQILQHTKEYASEIQENDDKLLNSFEASGHHSKLGFLVSPKVSDITVGGEGNAIGKTDLMTEGEKPILTEKRTFNANNSNKKVFDRAEQTLSVDVRADMDNNKSDHGLIGRLQRPEPANNRDLNVSSDGSSMLTQGFTTWKGDVCTELEKCDAMKPRERDQKMLLTEITELEEYPQRCTTNTKNINKQGESEEPCSTPSETKPNHNEKQFKRSLSLPGNSLSFDNPKVYYKDGHFCFGENRDKITAARKTRNGTLKKTKIETNTANTKSVETEKRIPEIGKDRKSENVMELFPGLVNMKGTFEDIGEVFADDNYSKIAFLHDEDFADADNAPLRHVYIPRRSRSPALKESESENFGRCRLPRSTSVDQGICDSEQFSHLGRTRNRLAPNFQKPKRSSSFKDAIEKDPVQSSATTRRSSSLRETSSTLDEMNLYSKYRTGSQSEDTVSLSRPKSPGFFQRMITRRGSFNEKNFKSTKSSESFKELVKKMSLKGIFKKNKIETLSQKSMDEQKSPPLAAFQSDEDIHSIGVSAAPDSCHAHTLPRRHTSNDIFSQAFANASTNHTRSRHDWTNRTISEDQMSVQSLNIQSQNMEQPQRPISPKPVGLSPSKRFSSRSIQNVYSLTKDLTTHSKFDFRQYSNKSPKVLKQDSSGEMELEYGEDVFLKKTLLKKTKDVTDGRVRDPCSASSPEKYSALVQSEMTSSNSNDSGIQHDASVNSSNESLKVTSDVMVTVKRRKSPSPRQERPKSEISVRWADLEEAAHVIKIKRREGSENVKDRPRPKSDLGVSSLESEGMKAFGSETNLLPYASLCNLEELRQRDAQQSNKPEKSRRMSTPHPIKSRLENTPPNQKRRNALVRSHSMPENLDKVPKQQKLGSAFGINLHMDPFTSSVDSDDSSDDSEYSISHGLQESRSLSAHSSRIQLTTLDEMPEEEENSTVAEALWDHITMDPEELGFRAGDLIQVIYMSDKDWWWGSLEEQEGWFPAAFVRLRVNQDQFEDDLCKRLESDILGSPKLRRVSMINKEQARANVVNEIINAEREYVTHLRDVVEGYIRHARRRSDMFTEDRILRIFGNIEAIYHFSSKFLSRLETCIHSSDPHLSELGKCFLGQHHGFEIYSDYCNNHPSACDELKELYRNRKYKHFFEACRLLQEMIEIPLEGFLLTPVQKICKYPLQLAELLKFTPPSHPDSEKVKDALEAMKKIAALINERKRKMESIEKLAVWQQAVEDWDGGDLLDTSSELIYSNEANKINSSGWSQERYFFLFDHQLIYCKKDLLKRNAFCYKGRVDLDQCEVQAIEDGKDTQYNVTVRNAWKLHETIKDKWYLLYAKSPSAKQRWLKAFQDERRRVLEDQENNFNIPVHWKTNAMKKLRAQSQKEKQQRTNIVPINYIPKDIPSHATLPRTHSHQEKKKSWFNFGRKAKR